MLYPSGTPFSNSACLVWRFLCRLHSSFSLDAHAASRFLSLRTRNRKSRPACTRTLVVPDDACTPQMVRSKFVSRRRFVQKGTLMLYWALVTPVQQWSECLAHSGGLTSGPPLSTQGQTHEDALSACFLARHPKSMPSMRQKQAAITLSSLVCIQACYFLLPAGYAIYTACRI